MPVDKKVFGLIISYLRHFQTCLLCNSKNVNSPDRKIPYPFDQEQFLDSFLALKHFFIQQFLKKKSKNVALKSWVRHFLFSSPRARTFCFDGGKVATNSQTLRENWCLLKVRKMSQGLLRELNDKPANVTVRHAVTLRQPVYHLMAALWRRFDT